MNSAQTALQLESLLYNRATGWNRELPKHLDSSRTLVLAFGSSNLPPDDAAFSDLRAAFPQSVIAGCSTSGEINGARLSDESVSVGVYRFREGTLRSAQAPVRGREDSFRAGALLAEQLNGPELRAVLVYSDGLNVNGTDDLPPRLVPKSMSLIGCRADGAEPCAAERSMALHRCGP